MRVALVAISVTILTISSIWSLYHYNRRNAHECPKRRKPSRQTKKMLHANRRNRTNERLKKTQSARRQTRARDVANMTREQKKEQRERICMQRVEQYVGVALDSNVQ